MWNEGHYCSKCRDTGKVDGSECACQVAVEESFDRFQIEQYKLNLVGPAGWKDVPTNSMSTQVLRDVAKGTFGYCQNHQVLYRRDWITACPLAFDGCKGDRSLEARIRSSKK
jgi:hypothetical protein